VPAPSPRRTPARSPAAGALVVAAVAAALRYPAFVEGGFVSHDVGGILYEAMVLRSGGLPYVDTVEMKAPLAFYLAALGLAGPGGHDITAFQRSAALLSVAVAAGFFVFAAARLRAAGAAVATVVFLLGAPFLDSMDANYVTWTMPLGFAAVAAALRGRARADLRWFAAAGALACGSALARRQGICAVPAVAWVAWTCDDRRLRALAAAAAGGIAAFVPLLVHYAAAGAAGRLLAGYFLNPWGRAYVGRVPFDPVEAARATAFFLAWPLSLLAVAVGRRRRPVGGAGTARGAMAVYLACAVLAAWVGGRFYKGYFLLSWPAAAYLAGDAWDRIAAPGASRLRRAVALAVFVGLGVRQAAAWRAEAAGRSIPRDRVQRRIAAFIEARTGPDDRIWCWGWHLWDLYALSGRLAASRVYKGLGLLTDPNDDTWRRPQSRLRFVDGPAARIVLDDFARTPPAVVVLGSTVPHRAFRGLRRLLAEQYRLDRTIRRGRLEIWVRRGQPRGGP